MIEPVLLRHLRACAASYCRARAVSLATVAQRVLGDWRFFDRAEEGKTFTARKYDEAMAWFATHWPDDTPWPADVPRPAPPAPIVGNGDPDSYRNLDDGLRPGSNEHGANVVEAEGG